MNSIIGQENLKQQLLKSVHENRVSHAYLFCGAKGIGKKTIAKAFATMLLCMKPNENEACGNCQSCLLIQNSSNPDLISIQAEEGKSEITVASARLIKDSIYIKPMICKRKVYIIVDAEKMNSNAQNCMLKTLEEPNHYVTIILTSSNPKMLMDTIKSRVIEYNLERNSAQEVEKYIRNNLKEVESNIEFIIGSSEGIIGRAVAIATSSDLQNIRESLLRLLPNIKIDGDDEIKKIFKENRENKENVEFILHVMTLFYRDMLVYKNTSDEKMLINIDKKDMIRNSVNEFTSRYLMNNIDLIEKIKTDINFNTNYINTIDFMLVKLQEDLI